MEKSIFREKSLEHLTSPEQLTDYLHVTRPSVWAVLAAIVIMFFALIAWADLTALETFAAGTAAVNRGVMTVTFDDPQKAGNVQPGQRVTIGAANAEITSVGKDAAGNIIATAETDLPDGVYSAKVGYDVEQVLDLLFK